MNALDIFERMDNLIEDLNQLSSVVHSDESEHHQWLDMNESIQNEQHLKSLESKIGINFRE